MAKAESLARWMRAQASSFGARGFVVGLNGTVETAVVARIAQLAAPGAVLGVLLPCNSDPPDDDAILFAERFSVPTVRLDLSAASARLGADLENLFELLPRDMRETARAAMAAEDGPTARLAPRLRMTALYFIAELLDYLVVGAGNRSEIAVGAFTKYGENSVDLLPLGHLGKAEVIALARDLNLPAEIIERSTEASTLPGSTTAGNTGFSYTELQQYLKEGPEGVSPALAMRIERLIRQSEHKRSMPLMPDQT